MPVSAYRAALREHGIVCSMSRRGNCWDNAVVESFFATVKTELIHRRSWPTRREVITAITEYIEVFYNRHRFHSFLAYRSPADYEEETRRTAAHCSLTELSTKPGQDHTSNHGDVVHCAQDEQSDRRRALCHRERAIEETRCGELPSDTH